MAFNPNNCPTASEHSLVEFCGNCGFAPGEFEGEEVWFICNHLVIAKDKATDVIVAHCTICGGIECPITIGDLRDMMETDHPKESHEIPAQTPVGS